MDDQTFPDAPGTRILRHDDQKEGRPGIDGGLMRRNMPGQLFTNYITVKSIDAMNQIVQTNGGTVILPKQEIGKGMGWISAFKDPENNVIGLHEMAPAARPRAAAKKSSAKRPGGKRAGKKRK